MITEKPVFDYLADLAQKSDDPRTKIAGAIQLLGDHWYFAYNNSIIFGVDLSTEEKYTYIEHVERQLIYNCAKVGASTQGATMYLLFEPCVECARAIALSGVSKIVVCDAVRQHVPERWKESLQKAKEILKQRGVKIEYDPVLVGKTIWFNNEEVNI
jgi:deoxycytidylate deaminase